MGTCRIGDSIFWGAKSSELIVACSDNLIRLWDTNLRQTTAVLEGHTSNVLCCEGGADQQTLVSGSFDRSVRLWDVCSTQLLATCATFSQSISDVHLSHNMEHVFASSFDGTARLIAIHDLSLTSVFAHDIHVLMCGLTHDSTRLTTCTPSGAFVWDAPTEKKLFDLGVSVRCDSCTINDNGSVVMASDWAQLVMMDCRSCSKIPLQTVNKSLISWCEFVDGRWALSCHVAGQALIWDLRTGLVDTVFETPVDRAHMSLDGRHIVCCDTTKAFVFDCAAEDNSKPALTVSFA